MSARALAHRRSRGESWRPLPHDIRMAVARDFGKVVWDERRKAWFIDCRPYGRIYTIRVGRQRVRLPSEEFAKDILAAIRKDIAETGLSPEAAVAEHLPNARNTVAFYLPTYLKRWERLVRAGERSPTSLREIERWAAEGGHWDCFRSLRVHAIKLGDLEAALPELSSKTRANVLGGFKAFLRWLWRNGELREMPHFPELSVVRRAPRVITIEQQEAVLQAIPWERRGIFLALAELVIRPGEVRALNVGDYSWETRELRIEAAMKGAHQSAPRAGTKTGVDRVRLVGDRLHAWLLEHVPPLVRRNASVPLFRNPASPLPLARWTHSKLDAAWRAGCTQAGVKIGVYNGCMHSTLSALRAAGVPLSDLQEIRGHGWIETTRGYAPLDPTRMREQLVRRLPTR